MCTTTEPRDINILLSLETYQGMTDEEIEKVIEYRAQQLFYSKDLLFQRAMQIERRNIRQAENQAALQIAQERLNLMREKIRNNEPLL